MASYGLDVEEDAEDAMATAAGTPGEMNESFTKEFLSCSICWEAYDDKCRQPKLLACHHTFCKGCLKKILRSKTVLQCSTCRKDTPVPDGVSSLQTNFYVMYMKQKFGDQLRSNHNVCYKHALQPLSFFCKTCTQMVCRDCIVLAHPKSEGHELQELNEVKAEYVLTLEQLRIKVNESINQRQGHLSCLRTELDTMDIVSEVTSEQIDKSFDSLVEVVNSRRQQVKDSLRETHESRHRYVNEQLVEIDNQTTRLIAIREQLDDATCKGQLKDLVDVATDQDLHQQIKSMTDSHQLNLGKNYFFYQEKDACANLQQVMSGIGEIKDMCMLPSRIQMDTDDAIACLKTTIKMQVSTHSGELLPRYPLSMDIVDPAGDEIACDTTDNHDGTYTVTFTPQISGAHLCTVKFLGHKIHSSCVSAAVTSNDPVNILGSMGKDQGKLMYPCSLKIDENEDIYVVDEGNQRIQKFRSDGKVEVISVAGPNKNARTFDCAIDIQNDELICSKVMVEQRKAWADTIQIYSLDGTPKHQFTNSGMKKALYVTVNSAQQIVVPDYHLNMLFIYDHRGNLLKSVGQSGNGPGEFKEPAFVCIGKNDDIIISDCRNSRVQVLNKHGEFQYQIGKKGTGKGQLQGPSGVTTDNFGHILVTDRVNNRIQVYTYKGEFVSCIESTGSKLNDPRGLAVSSDGHVFVADQKNHCIKQYRYMSCV